MTAARTIAHVSDLHFGTEDPAITAGLMRDLDGTSAAQPSLVVVSGDLTQRATAEQFGAARAFLDRIPGPYVVVPGNHDVPLYAVFSRLFRPLARYYDHITAERYPTFFDDVMGVVGVATAHGWTIKGGRITSAQLRAICERIAPHPTKWKILVAHHPFVVGARGQASDVADGAAAALPALERCGIDIILTGHTHVTDVSDATYDALRTDDHRIVTASAGTCISTRVRGEPNGYNRLRLDGDDLTITHRIWNGARFEDGIVKTYRRGSGTAATFARTA